MRFPSGLASSGRCRPCAPSASSARATRLNWKQPYWPVSKRKTAPGAGHGVPYSADVRLHPLRKDNDMTVSTSALLKGHYDATRALGAKAISSDFSLEIEGFEQS